MVSFSSLEENRNKLLGNRMNEAVFLSEYRKKVLGEKEYWLRTKKVVYVNECKCGKE